MPSNTNPMQAPLEGLQLIEASAGTGKTYTISGLFLRLLLEKKLRVQDVLVVTFTKAATEELRDRIRKRLVDALVVFTAAVTGQNVETSDDLLLQLLEQSDDKLADLDLLRIAVFSFDQVPLLTIHAFSQRVLQDHAFGAAVPFECELIEDESELFQQVVDDYWRKLIPELPRQVLVSLVAAGGVSSLSAGLRSWADKPVLTIPVLPRPGGDGEAQWQAALAEFSVGWAAADDAREYLLRSTDLNRNKLRATIVERIIKQYDKFVVGGSLPKDANRFGTEFILAPDKVKKGKEVRRFPLYDVVDRVLEAHEKYQHWLDTWQRALQLELLQTLRTELPARKQQQRLRGYSDFLSDLNVALEGDSADHLIDSVRSKFSAALIDEFQDTDELQFNNFYRLFVGEDFAMPVFMVGDPKQAIYSFRGADIYAYLHARNKAENSYNLATNWRSTPPLIDAVNTLFVRRPSPFVIDDIQYFPVAAADKHREQLRLPTALGSAAMTLMRLPDNEGRKARSASHSIAESLRHCADSIAEILLAAEQGDAVLINTDGKERSISGSDIAVIVRSNSQGATVQRLLQNHGVSAIRTDQASVWTSDESDSVLRLLLAINDPRPPVIRAMLATPLFGFTVATLNALKTDELAWDAWLLQLRKWRGLWREHGLARCWQQIAEEHRISERLLQQSGGSRMLTNTNHVMELLAAESQRQSWDSTATLQWFHLRISEDGGGDASLLRLDSDDDLVRIVTVHKSKGLEYPLVFCPAAFAAVHEPKGLISWHGDDGKAELGFAATASDEVLSRWQKEQLAEDMRLLYVALTRAAHRCWLYCGAFDTLPQKNALAWLLHGEDDAIGDMSSIVGDSNPESIAVIDVKLEADDEEAEAVLAFEPEDDAVTELLQARIAERNIRQSWRLTSFTGIGYALQAQSNDELTSYVTAATDYDQKNLGGTEPLIVEPVGAHAFPRGARAGTCLHWMFENMNFAAADDAHLADLAERGLQRYGYSEDWQENAVTILRQTIATPLSTTGASLSDLKRGEWLPEMEFHYPLKSLSGDKLLKLLVDEGFGENTAISERLRNRGFAPIDGFMKGFIDLIFEADGRYYLADYKSNWLGADASAYDQPSMTHAIAEADYYLQYLIYSLALHRYLKTRIADYDYERHFGGCLYLFIRGMGEGGNGVYFDRPSEALLSRIGLLVSTDG